MTYPDQPSPTLQDVTLHVGAGEFLCIVGPSGAGKTTLLRLLTGQLRPTAGTAIAAGLDLTTLPSRKLPTLRRRVGITFQDAKLLPGRTVRDNVVYALELAGTGRRRAQERADEALDLVGISHLADRSPERLSGGEAQRVGIARALAGDPHVLLADEPTGNLDPDTSATIVNTLVNLTTTGTAVLMVTHDHDTVRRLGHRTVQISDGTLIPVPSDTITQDTAR